MSFFHIRLVALLAAALAVPLLSAAAQGVQLPVISQTNVEMVDIVTSAQEGRSVVGSPLYAYRDGDTVRYFASDATCAEYVANPAKYPDVRGFKKFAFMGADPVAFFTKGVHDPASGAIIAGNPDKYRAVYKGATYAFAFEANMRAFKANPREYIPLVGGYCLGAMSRNDVTPGDPRFHLFIPEVGQWAVFGSPNGPITFASMTPAERLAAAQRGTINWLRKTGQEPVSDKIAILH